MAETKANIPVPAGLPDMSKINYAGVTSDEAQNIQASTEKYLQDLENRYAQPNWWKVAAGFAKPQLGGFMASLGSAADALGENIEQQRAIAPTISMMRAQLAQQQPGIRQAQKAAQMAADRKGPITEDYVRSLEEQGDTPVARAARKSYESAIKERELAHSEFADAMSRVQYARTQPGMKPDPRDLAIISRAATTQETNVGPKPPAPDAGGPPEVAPVVPPMPSPAPSSLGLTTSANAKPEDADWAKQVSAEISKAYALATAPLPDYLSGDPSKMSEQGKAAVAAFRAAQDRAKEDLLSLTKEGARHGAVPSMGGMTAPTGATPAAAPAEAPKKPVWSDPSYPIKPPPTYPTLSTEQQNAQLKSNTEKSQEYVNDISKVIGSPDFVTRKENLISLAAQLQDPNVRTWLSRSSPTSLSNIIKNAMTSGSTPDAVGKALSSTHSLLPTDPPAMVEAVQKYVQNLAQESLHVNNLTNNPTNQKIDLERFAAIPPEMQPKAAMLKIAEELHKMQRLNNMPYVLSPYASHGYSISEMLNSDRNNEFNQHWSKLHRALPKFANDLQLPTSLTAPEAFKPGFNYESMAPKK